MKKAPAISDAAIDSDGDVVSVTFADGASARFHAEWLRDNCQDETSRDPVNGQRLFQMADLPDNITVQTATPTAEGGLRVLFATDEHETSFSAQWLRANQYDRMRRLPSGWIDPSRSTFDASLADAMPTHDFATVTSSPDARKSWLSDQVRLGFSLLTNCPAKPGTVAEVARLFGFVRTTNYGEVFDVRSEADPINLAYTSDALSAHTDNPYRNPVPGLQLLHCLEAAGSGGESFVVDGFKAATKLNEDSPRHFAMLSEWPMRFEFRSADTWLVNEAPMIGLETSGELTSIRFNNRSATAPRLPFDATPGYYAAYRAFAKIINSPELAVSFKLSPGDLFVVDNTRVLHGRQAFSIEKGARHIQGCYADLDGLHSTLRLL